MGIDKSHSWPIFKAIFLFENRDHMTKSRGRVLTRKLGVFSKKEQNLGQ